MSKPPSPQAALRHVFHAVWLQILAGAVMFVLVDVRGKPEDSILFSKGAAGLLIGSGINTLLYLRRFEKAWMNAPLGTPAKSV